MTKFFNAILILILVVVGGRLLMRGQEYRALSQERNQLVEKLDGFRVRDSSKYLVQMVATDDPKLFMWRVHKPGGFELSYLLSFGGAATVFDSGLGSRSKLDRVSVRFEFVGSEFSIDVQAIGVHRFKVYDTELATIYQQHWEDLEIEALGQEGLIEMDVNQKVDLFQVTVSDELLTKLEAKFGQEMAQQFSKKLFRRFSLGERGVIERNREELRGGPR